jgi:DNA-binding XRE family transcriptional regulator
MYPNLRAEMARKRITNETMAKLLGINSSTMSAKLNEKGRLKLWEARKIHSVFFAEIDFVELFTTEDEINKAS